MTRVHDVSEPAPIDVPAALRNILMVLQKQPVQYRNFGVWWWPVKRLMKTKYSAGHLFLLGGYEDPAARELTPELPPADMLRQALETYTMNRRYLLGSNRVQDLEGQPYLIVDDDAGGL